jgi:hypothetical protein
MSSLSATTLATTSARTDKKTARPCPERAASSRKLSSDHGQRVPTVKSQVTAEPKLILVSLFMPLASVWGVAT